MNFQYIEYYNQAMLGDAIKRLDGPVFVTGHTGFKGSWLTLLLNHLNIEQFGYALEPEENSLFRRANLEGRTKGVLGDIRNLDFLSSTLKEVRPSVVIHLAAQPLVLNSYEDPLETFQINCLGTANVLHAALNVPSIKIVLVVTTDKVYLNNNSAQKFTELDPLGGRDPYSASKVAAEAVCLAWQQISDVSGGPRVLVARAGNVIGGGDFARHRIIPDIVRAVMFGQDLVIRNPLATRPWQHVLDPLFGYLQYIESSLLHTKVVPALNFGPSEPSLRVDRVVEIGQKILDRKINVVHSEGSHKLESKTLELDSSLARMTIGWRPNWNQEKALTMTFSWWKDVLSGKHDSYAQCINEIKSMLTPR